MSQSKFTTLSCLLSTLRQQLSSPPTLSPDPCHPFLLTISLRRLLREITDELELKRKQVQLKKQKIEKSKSYLEGLEYYKSMLANRIQVCDVAVEEVEGTMEEEVRPRDWIDGFEKATQRMKEWIEEAKRQRAVLARKKISKEEVDGDIKKRKKLYNQELPGYLSKLEDNFKNIMNVFEIPTTYLLNPVKNQQLLNLYSYFMVAKESKLIQLDYQDDVITLTIPPQSRWSKLSAQNQFPLEPKQIKINIQLVNGDITVVGIDRSCDFTNEEIFHRLVGDQPVVLLYPNPQNQEQRNNNNRFVKLNWVESIARKSLNLEVSAEQVVDRVVERGFGIQLAKGIVEGLRSNKLGFYFRLAKEGESGTVNLKKLSILNVSKITWQAAKQQMFTPFWISKLSKFFVRDSQGTVPFKQIAEEFNLQQSSQSIKCKMYETYRVSLTYNEHNTVFLLMFPTNYPSTKSVIKILHYSDKRQRKQPDTSSLSKLPLRLPPINPKNTASDFLKIEEIEREVNENMEQFMESVNPVFYVLYQVNRMFGVLEEVGRKEGNGTEVK